MPTSKLTIAIVSTQRGWHGGEEQARLLAQGLRVRGHRCVVVARRDGAFAHRMADERFEVFGFFGGGRGPVALWQMRHCLERIKPDVLHYNDPHAITAAGLAGMGLGIPVRIAARRVDFRVRSARRYRWFCDRLICVSNAVADVCQEGRIPKTMLRVVHDGVDPARMASGDRCRGRLSLGLAADQPLLLCVATLTDHKGHRFLLDALPEVIRRYPNLVMALAGDGELREALEQHAVALGIASQVHFLGFRNDVHDLIHACDLFVLPSHLEGLCSTLIDVMLSGRPIVTTTAGGIPDLVGLTPSLPPELQQAAAEPVAWTVPPRSPKALGDAILEALASPAVCLAMQERAQRRAKRFFTADCMVEGTLEVYREAKR